jgi:hypothetical protein
MAIFTASEATASVKSLASQTAATAYQNLIDSYQGIFDLIQSESALGHTTITWNLKRSQYLEIQPILVANGYTVSAWTAGSDTTLSSVITISWPATTTVVTPTYPALISILPNTVVGQQNLYFYAKFAVSGGVAPYTYVITGNVPAGLTWSTLTNVYTIVLSGTPTQAATEYNGFSIKATDSANQVIQEDITWTIANSTVLTVVTNTPGTQSLSYSSATGALTFTPYSLPTATTSSLGAVKPDNASILIANGQLSVNPTTTALDARMRSIAVAASVAFGI